MPFPAALERKILDYYRQYYRDCGIKPYEALAQGRLHEEEREQQRLEYLQDVISYRFGAGQKHLDVGAGTGGVAAALHQAFRCEVYGVEPSKAELEIIHGKCAVLGMDVDHFTSDSAEQMHFADNFFDFVHCVTVLEHVHDVRQVIREMIRVTKPGGFVYINTPNYLFPR
jgi:2-polyprenyl-6-hydroxyphenyl methylase/3-demethylubiquinone-9 3-methyltransferase